MEMAALTEVYEKTRFCELTLFVVNCHKWTNIFVLDSKDKKKKPKKPQELLEEKYLFHLAANPKLYVYELSVC